MAVCGYNTGCIDNSEPVMSNLNDFSFISIRLIIIAEGKKRFMFVCLFIPLLFHSQKVTSLSFS